MQPSVSTFLGKNVTTGIVRMCRKSKGNISHYILAVKKIFGYAMTVMLRNMRPGSILQILKRNLYSNFARLN